ncbi:MAG: hypothetical protein IJ736_10720 [Firmicutes bacterium]|nr:hypothetical protein [Bacillota bacterium]
MDSFTELAKEIQKRNNQKIIGVCVGEVINLTPVTFRIYYNGEPIDFDEFFNIKGLVNDDTGVTEGDLYLPEYPVEIGDKFICITGTDNQSLYVLCKFEAINKLCIFLR